jgi:hypothetical protein
MTILPRGYWIQDETRPTAHVFIAMASILSLDMPADHATLKAIERNGVDHVLYWCHWPKMRLVEHPRHPEFRDQKFLESP